MTEQDDFETYSWGSIIVALDHYVLSLEGDNWDEEDEKLYYQVTNTHTGVVEMQDVVFPEAYHALQNLNMAWEKLMVEESEIITPDNKLVLPGGVK